MKPNKMIGPQSLYEELKMGPKAMIREEQSEGDAQEINEDFFKLEDNVNKSIRSKATIECMSELEACYRKCQHRHNHDHFTQHLEHVIKDQNLHPSS